MLPTSHPRRTPQAVPAAFCALLLCLLVCVPGGALAVERNTAFLPFKINAPDAAALVAPADAALAREVAAKGLTMVNRAEAERLVAYDGPWPPPAAAISRVADATGADYVVVGSLNKLGRQISVDCAIFDVLAPTKPHSTFREAESMEELDRVTGEIVGTMLTFSNRSATVAAIAPEGNERIDAGAILQKISTKPGDLYDPATLRQDLKNVFAMGYFDNVEIEATDTETGKNVLSRVKEKPLIGSVVITGAEEIKEEDIRDAAGITANSILNPAKVNDAVAKVRELYKS